MSRVVIGDDHPLVQAALADAVGRALPAVKVECGESLDAVLSAVEREPESVELVLLDLNMPGTFGFAGLFLLAAQFPTVPVAIVSAVEDASVIRRALRFGAVGYLPKSLSLSMFGVAVRAIVAGEVWSPPGVAALTGTDDADDDLAQRLASLSPQQLRILTMIVAGKLNKQIAGDLGIAEQTVKVHVSAILRKLGVISRTRAAVLADRLLPK